MSGSKRINPPVSHKLFAMLQLFEMLDAVRHCSFSARLDCHYLVRAPETAGPRTLLFVALHGFGQTPEIMLPLTAKLVGNQHVVAALEAPSAFFLPTKPGEPFQAGCSWATNRHAPSAVRLHHEMVRHVLSEAGREYGIPPERRFLVGFSQPVSLNYRFAATCPGAVRGVVGLCGGIPSDWETGPYRPVDASILHIARREDEFYPAAKTEQYDAKLRLRCEDVEFHLIDGGHRFPSQGGVILEGWLGRILR
jgi:predicted esterase